MNTKHWNKPCARVDCKKPAEGLKYVTIPASLGDDVTGKALPKNGAYANAIVKYEANGALYVYSAEGVPVHIETGGGSSEDTKYTFTNTSHGWSVRATDGYSFAHTDTGGGGGGGAIIGEGEPTIDTVADEGQTYLDETTGLYYLCFKAENDHYFWAKIETETPISSYGTVWYYSDFSVSFEEEWAENCIINSIDTDKLSQFLAENGGDHWINFDYREEYDPETGEPTGEYFWMFLGMEGEVIIYPEDMLATTGIDVSIEDPEMPWAMFSVIKSVSVDTESEVVQTDILTKAQYESLGGQEFWVSLPLANGVSVPGDAIYKVHLSQDVSYIPESFLAFCSNLSIVDDTDSVMSEHSLELHHKSKIGNSAFTGWHSLASAVFFAEQGIEELHIGNSVLVDSFSADEPITTCLVYAPYIYIDGSFAQSSNLSEFRLNGGSIMSLGPGFCAYSNVREVHLGTILAEKIEENFCSGCPELYYLSLGTYNKVQEIGDSFVSQCPNLQSLQELFDGLKNVSVVGNGFMVGTNLTNGFQNVQNFVKKLRTVGGSFLAAANTGYGSLQFNSLINYNPDGFLYNTGILTVDFYSLEPDTTWPYWQNKTFLATDDQSSVAYTQGRTVRAQNADAWIAQYPDEQNVDGYIYRKLIAQNTGGGNSYSFSNTSDGWQVSGSDGSYFSHTDMGGAIDIGKAKNLTTADYNYPTYGTKTSLAPWLLDAGIYTISVEMKVSKTSGSSGTVYPKMTMIIGEKRSGGGEGNYKYAIWDGGANAPRGISYQVWSSSGNASYSDNDYWGKPLLDIVTQTTGQSTADVMSQKAVTDAIDSVTDAIGYARITTVQSAPTRTTPGVRGQFVTDPLDDWATYLCVAADEPNNSYTWKKISS